MWAGKRGRFHCASSGAEDARDAVRFRQYGRVAQRKTEAYAKLLRGAAEIGRLLDDEERHGVAEQYAGEQHEARLAARRANHGRVAEADELDDDEECGDDAAEREHAGADRHSARVAETRVPRALKSTQRTISQSTCAGSKQKEM